MTQMKIDAATGNVVIKGMTFTRLGFLPMKIMYVKRGGQVTDSWMSDGWVLQTTDGTYWCDIRSDREGYVEKLRKDASGTLVYVVSDN